MSTKPVISSFNKLAEMVVHKYERYLPTAFDESLSLVEKMNKVIQYLNDIGVLVNGVVEQWNEVMEWVMADGLTQAISDKLDEMVLDGTLNTIINQQIFGDLMFPATVENLQATIDDFATRNVKLTLKRTTFEVTETILIPNNIEIDWNGSTVKRKAGGFNDCLACYDLIRNADLVTGSNIKMRNLKLDGNYAVDGLVQTNVDHRFSGIRLKNVDDFLLEKISVTGVCSAEIQPEKNDAGVLIEFSKGTLKDVEGSYNLGTAYLFVESEIIIDGSYTHDNKPGSGVSSYKCPNSKYYNTVTHDNGYSNLSVNGEKSIVDNVYSYNSGYTGLNIGHDGQPTDYTVVTNVISFDNTFEGITIEGTKNVQLSNINVWGNKRNNIRVMSKGGTTHWNNLISRNSQGGQGILLQGGKDHKFTNSKVFENFAHGLYADTGTSVIVGDSNEFFNNGKGVSGVAGITLVKGSGSIIGACHIYDDQATKTQTIGVLVSTSQNININHPFIETTTKLSISVDSTNIFKLVYDGTELKLNDSTIITKELSGLSGSLGATSRQVLDANLCDSSGLWYLPSNSTNIPTAQVYTIQTAKISSDTVTQLAISQTGKAYSRCKFLGTWTAWVDLSL